MKIKLYTIKSCKTCLLIKEYFDIMNVRYEEIDCDKNMNETIDVIKSSGSNELPIIKYNEKDFIVGYDKNNLEKLYKLYKD